MKVRVRPIPSPPDGVAQVVHLGASAEYPIWTRGTLAQETVELMTGQIRTDPSGQGWYIAWIDDGLWAVQVERVEFHLLESDG